jgi:hypothetical protein
VASRRTAFDEEEKDGGIETDPNIWLERARKAADGGDYRPAFRAVFLATLCVLHDACLIRIDAATTNGEYIRILHRGGRTQFYRTVRALARDFDERWYGGHATDRLDYERGLAVLADIRRAVAATAPQGARDAAAEPS